MEWGLKYYEDLTKMSISNVHLIAQKYIQILKEQAVSSVVMQKLVSSALRSAGQDSHDSCD